MNLQEIASKIRSRIIENSHKTNTPHLGSCLSCVDILVALYWNILRIDPKNPTDSNRDRFILSKGHGAPALYHVLCMKGFYPESFMADYGEDGSLFSEHPQIPGLIPGIEAATGSLGHGLSIAAGMALAGRIQKQDYNVYALLSDGECNEGSIWEAAMFAAANKLDRLCVIVDYNKWQATERSDTISGNTSLANKWEAFGWLTYEVDGHNIQHLINLLCTVPILKNLYTTCEQPKAIIAHTIKGKGVSFMEDNNNWHYKIPNEEEVEKALLELNL